MTKKQLKKQNDALMDAICDVYTSLDTVQAKLDRIQSWVEGLGPGYFVPYTFPMPYTYPPTVTDTGTGVEYTVAPHSDCCSGSSCCKEEASNDRIQ